MADGWTPVEENSAWTPVAETAPQAPPKPGFLARVSQGIPKSWHEAAATMGVPTSWQEFGQMAQEGQIPGDPASAMLHGYAKTAYRGLKEAGQEAMEAGANVAEGGPLGANLGKAAYGGLHGALQVIPGMGPVVETAGQDVQDKNYAGAAGGVVNALAQYGLMRAAPEDVSTTKATAPVRATVKALNKALQKAPGTLGTAGGAAVGAATGLPYAAEVGAGLGGVVGREVLPQIKLPGEGFGLPNRVTGGPSDVPSWIDKPPAESDEIGADATRENKPYAGENYGKPWEAQHDATPRNKEYAGEDLGKLLQMKPEEAMKIPLSETPKVGTQAGADMDTALFKQASAELPNGSLSDKLTRAQELKSGAVGGNGIPGPATVEPSPSSEAYKSAPVPEGTRVPGEDEDLSNILTKSVEKVNAAKAPAQYDDATVAEAKRQLAAQGYDPAHIDKAMELLSGNSPANAFSQSINPDLESGIETAPHDVQAEADQIALKNLEQKISAGGPERLKAIADRTNLINRMNGTVVPERAVQSVNDLAKRKMAQPRDSGAPATTTRKNLQMTEEDFIKARKNQRKNTGA